MISFFKKLRRDRRGNALVIAGAALPLVMGCAGIACDTIQWTLWKRQLQRAADSAAMAGVYAVVDGKSHSTGVDNDLTTNNHSVNDHAGTALTDKTVTQPTVAGFTNAVRVSLSMQKRLTFSSMFMSELPTITAAGTAAVSKEGEYCVIALNNTTTASIQINGNVTLNTGCGIISNSTSSTNSISVDGTSHIVNAVPIAGVGGVPAINGANTELSYQLKQTDPYAGKYPTAIPDTLTAKTLAQHIAHTPSTVTVGSETYQIIQPGHYKRDGNGNNAASSAFSTSNQAIALDPGVYYIDSADFEIGANSKIIVNPSAATSAGVTIILTGDTPGRVNIDSNADVRLRAPSDGATNPYNTMLFIQKAGATASSIFTGNSTSSFDGTFYFPSTTVDYNGGGSSMFKCAMIVGNIVSFSGNSSVQNNTTGCYANTKVQIDKVRLVA